MEQLFPSKKANPWILYVGVYPTTLFTYIAPLALMSRMWIFYYQSQLNRIYQNAAWRVAIDPSNESNNNWFVKYIKYLGNKRFLFKISCLIGICGISIFSVIIQTGGGGNFGGDIVGIVIYSGMCVAGCYLGFKLKHNTVDDNLGIRRELFCWIKFIPPSLIAVGLIPRILIWIEISDNWVLLVRYSMASIVGIILMCVLILYPKSLQQQQQEPQSLTTPIEILGSISRDESIVQVPTSLLY